MARALLAAATAALLLISFSASADAVTLPAGFQDTTVISGLVEPTTFRFASDGRVFVAEKQGVILVYDGLDDDQPTEFADLRESVYDVGDHGILGMALDPGFPARPYVYVLYGYNHELGDPSPPPRWPGDNGPAGDKCPLPEGADVDGCPVSGRLVRLTADGDHAAPTAADPAEELLLEGWCQQSSTHSIGDLEFGPEGALFVSGGDGAAYASPDYGQFGWPHKNQCGDPPGGEALAPPDAEGGSLRSQDLRTAGDPTGLNGAVLRVDPDTGEGLPDNPLAASADANARRIVAFGFRNPFRFAIDRASDEVYVDNVGNGAWEEIDRFSTAPALPYNSGWPCYEGPETDSGFDYLGLSICEGLYDEAGSTSYPFFAYRHTTGVTAEDPCPYENGSAISGSTFYEGAAYPEAYRGALFFSDSVRGCIYAMRADSFHRPDPATTAPFLTEGGLYPGVDIQEGPDGDLYYSRLFGDGFGSGSIHRIAYFAGNQPPLASLTATPEWAQGPLQAEFDAGGSTDPDGDALSYEWDLDGDGTFEGASADSTREASFSDGQNHTVAVRVRDGHGATSIARATVYPGDTPPVPEIVTPLEDPGHPGQSLLAWHVGQPIAFEGSAEDGEDGAVPATSLDWTTRLYHCPGGAEACHAHPLQAFPGTDSGTLIAPDHDYPSHLELRLAAEDSRGLAAERTISLYPQTAGVELESDPPGIPLTAGLLTEPAPFPLTAIEGSHLTVSGPDPVQLDGVEYSWSGWSDGGDRAHVIEAGVAPSHLLATYARVSPPGGGGGAGDGGQGEGGQAPQVPGSPQTRKPKPLRCRKGFTKKKVRGKTRCVKRKKKRKR